MERKQNGIKHTFLTHGGLCFYGDARLALPVSFAVEAVAQNKISRASVRHLLTCQLLTIENKIKGLAQHLEIVSK